MAILLNIHHRAMVARSNYELLIKQNEEMRMEPKSKPINGGV